MFNSIVAHGEELNVKPPENSFFRYFYRFYLGRGLVGREPFFFRAGTLRPPPFQSTQSEQSESLHAQLEMFQLHVQSELQVLPDRTKLHVTSCIQ